MIFLRFSMGRSIYRRSRQKLFYQSRIKPHLLYTIRQRSLRATKWYIIYKEIRSLSYLYGNHNYAESGFNVVNGLVDPQLGPYLPITDMLLRGFLVRRTRICIPFASKSHWLNSNQQKSSDEENDCLKVNEGEEFKYELYSIPNPFG